ncbi:MAG TPA: alpha/beta hydrolase [Methylomirabilota bacterium]|nr:alpha/beta hydrolase [Methylomirabilota bacterium]
MARGVLVTALGFLGGCGAAIERGFIYYPASLLVGTPRDLGLPFEDVHPVAADGVRLHGWFVPGPRAVTLLWCHGNAGNISHRLENLGEIHRRLGVGILLFDYRGYGRSEGVPSEAGLYADARAFRAWLRARPGSDREPVVYFGRSLGAAVAAALAEEDRPAALILETPFISVQAMANQTLPGAGYLFRTRFDTLDRIGRIPVPLLVLHGDADEVVPFRHGEAIFAAAAEPKTFVRIPGSRHNETWEVGGSAYWDAWTRFLTAHASAS